MIPVPPPPGAPADPSPTGPRDRPRRVLRTLGGAVQLLVLLAAVGVVLAQVSLGVGVQRVLSDSMRPAFAAGDHLVVVERPAEALRVGDVPVLTFSDGDLRAHRVVAVEREGAALRLLTRGDANTTDDSWTEVRTDGGVPVVVGHLPALPAAVRTAAARVQADPVPYALLLGLGGVALTVSAMRRQLRLMRSCTCPRCLDRRAARTPRPEPVTPQEIR